MKPIIAEIEKEYHRQEMPSFEIGDMVGVHLLIREGEKERIQVFKGTVIARCGRRASETFTVRRIVQGEGVERVFMLHSPRIAKIEVLRRGRVRRAKLYYLRKRTGRAARVRERLGQRDDQKKAANT